jgi:ABC-2 type transport system permease protein
MSTIGSLYVANMKEFIRDRGALFWTFAFPILFILLFGAIFSGNNSVSYNVGLVNQDTGPVGAQLANVFTNKVSAFKVKTGSYSDEMNALKKGNLDLVIVIPAGLSQTVAQGHTAQVEMFNDPSKNATDAQIQQSIVTGVLDAFNRAAEQNPPALALTTTSIVSSSLSEIDFLMPGILAMSLMQLGLFATATPLVSLREEGVLRRLGATPLPRWMLIIGQLGMRVTIAMVQAVLIIGISVALFHVKVQGSYLALFGLVLLGALSFIGLGYLIAALARTVETANGVTSAVNFPMMFLSGIFFPLAVLPAFLLPFVRIIPLTYLADALRQVTAGSTPAFPMWIDVAVLAGWGLVCTALAARFFRWD